jgi:hypothetical protein
MDSRNHFFITWRFRSLAGRGSARLNFWFGWSRGNEFPGGHSEEDTHRGRTAKEAYANSPVIGSRSGEHQSTKTMLQTPGIGIRHSRFDVPHAPKKTKLIRTLNIRHRATLCCLNFPRKFDRKANHDPVPDYTKD